MLARRMKQRSRGMGTPYTSSWTGAHENFQAREYDARASQASQHGDKGQLEKRLEQILKYLESLMKPSSGGTLVLL
jgi:hypothetical protein